MVCSSMKSPGVAEEQIRLRVFPFSLKDVAKDWLYYLRASSITTWAQLKKKFLEKFFPVSRATSLRKEICSIKQYFEESLYDYWERSIIDTANGGVLANKTPKEAWELIEAMAKNSQQLAMENTPRVKVCGIYTSMDHCTDMCPLLQEDGTEQVNMAGGVLAPRRQYDPYSNTYNPDWRDHPNLSYGNRPQNSFPNRPPGFQQPWQLKPPASSKAGSSLEDIVKSLATTTAQIQQETRQLQQETRLLTSNMAQFQQETKSDMKDMEARISQMATTINRLESHAHEKLPSQPEVNPKNVSATTLRSDKELKGPKVKNSKSKSEKEIEKEIEEE
nr:uncharacterized protein LOC113735783 [Coffea arabica]